MHNYAKTAKVFLNSKDRMTGTNDEASFKVNLPTELKTDKLAVTLNNFIQSYPTGTDAGIVQIDMIGINNPNSFSSSNMNTHRTLGMINIEREGTPREYPPSAMTGNNTNITNKPYGTGTYVASVTSGDSGTGSAAWHAFDKQYDLYKMRTSFSNANFYNGTTGFYEGSASNSTIMSGSNYFGEHLTLQLPTQISLQSYSYTTNSEWGNRSATQWVIGGSVNGTDWTLLDTESNVFWNGANETKVFQVPGNTRLFNYYRMLVTRVGNSNSSSFRNDWGISELKLFGYTNPQSFGQTTLEYPPTVLTGNTTVVTNQIYGNGTYSLSNSGALGGTNAIMFNKVSSGWFSSLSNYNATTGIYSGSTVTSVDGSNVAGEWVQITLPDSIYLQSHTLQSEPSAAGSPYKGPSTIALAGSADGTNFTRLDTRSNLFWTSDSNWSFNFVVNSSNNLKTYRLITSVVGNSNQNNYRNFFSIAEWTLYGYSNIQNISRSGQLNMNAEVITTDRSLFDRPITLKMTSPSGINLTSMSDWSAEISVREML